MSEMIAYCGLVCTSCPQYIATQNDDDIAREKIAKQIAEKFGLPGRSTRYPALPPQTRTSGIPAYGSSIPTLFAKPETKQVPLFGA